MSKDGPLEGTLGETPFPRLLFEIWRDERTGRLGLKRAAGETRLYFEKGQIVVARESFVESEFLASLVRRKILTEDQARRAEQQFADLGHSTIKALSDLGFLTPIPLWSLVESYFVRRLFALFDTADGSFLFEPDETLPGGSRLGLLQAPDLILQGVRRMQNEALMATRLPGEEDPIRLAAPYFMPLLHLEPHERYALRILGDVSNLRKYHERSELGARDNRKVLFAFDCLGILLSAGGAGDSPEASAPRGSEQVRVLEAIDEKCTFIFRFVSKEIGPLAGTVLGRALDEVKSSLGPIFEKASLQYDGTVEVDAALRLSADHLPEDLFQTIVRGFDEILAAEVLAVKKNLGPAHETALVRNLERIGCV